MKANINKLNNSTIEHYTRAGEKGSTGSANSMFEVAVRRYMAKNGVKIEFTEGHGKADIRIGRSTWIEIKTCCGEVGNDTDCLASVHRAKYVFYVPDLPDYDTIVNDAQACFESCFVFTAEQFEAMLCFIHKGGKEPHIKYNAARGTWNIQTLRTYNKKTGKWSEKPYTRFWEFIAENNIDNASIEFLDAIRK